MPKSKKKKKKKKKKFPIDLSLGYYRNDIHLKFLNKLGEEDGLESINSIFRLHLMPVAVGMYLPFGLSTPILIGGLLAHFILADDNSGEDSDSVLQKGVLLSSGLIAGEALMGIILAFVAGAGIQSLSPSLNPNLVTGLTLLAAVGTILWLYNGAKSKNKIII